MVSMETLGLFSGNGDIGTVGAPGSASFDDGVYTVSASGYNMWFDRDEFHFVWTEVQGDVALAASVAFAGDGRDPHRKACLVVRATLDAESAYADIAVHGDGLTSLQYRVSAGAVTQEVQSNRAAPARVELRREGDYVTAFADGSPTGGSVKLALPETYYVGLAVSSHLHDVVETARFSEVELSPIQPHPTTLYSTLEIMDVASTDRRTVHVFEGWVEAPNWTADDRLVFNSEGRLFSIPVNDGPISPIDTGFADRCNNDHGVSPDGTRIAISDQSQDDGDSVIYTVPIGGGEPTRITSGAPSYWHGWSPDGTTLAFCGQRDGTYGIFTIPANGGIETRLTTAEHLDDGPDFSPDGRYIYFNSDRTGLMQIYRIEPDGSGLERITADETNDWFPHVSPDGRWLVYIAFDTAVQGHPRDQHVELKLIDLVEGGTRTIAPVFGGQGTMNVPSWSPDSTRFAFVSYAYL